MPGLLAEAGDLIASVFAASAPEDVAAASTAADIGTTAAATAAAAAPEVVTVTAPAIGTGLTAGDLATAGLTAAGTAAGVAGAAGATPAAAAPAAAQQPSPLPTQPLGQPISTSPAAAATAPPAAAPSAATSPPIGGPGGSAVSTAAPPSVAGGPPPSPAQDLSIGGGGQTSLGTPAATSPGAAATSPAAGAGMSPGETSLVNTANANLAANPAPAAGSEAPSPGGTLSGVKGFLKDNSQLLSVAAAVGGLGYDLLNGNKPLPNQAQIQTNANQLNASAQQLQSYINSGTLPPGIQAGITQASEAAKAAIRSQYASMDDTGSSAEAQDLSSVDSRAATQSGQLAISLLQQGISEQGMADTLYQDLMGTALQQDQELGSAIGTFASALVPTTPTIKIAA